MRHRWTIGVVGWLAGAALAAEPQVVNGLLAIVDQDVITYKDMMQYIAPTVETLMRAYGDKPEVLRQRLQEAQREGLEQLVERKLILHEFERSGFNLPETLIDDRVKERLRERFGGDRAAMTKTLQSQGTTYEGFRRQIREEFIVSAMRAKHLGSDIIISPHRIERYYAENLDKFKIKDQVRFRAILLKGPPVRAREVASGLGQELLTKLEEGADFAELASVYSEDDYRAQGGFRGEKERHELRSELADVLFQLRPGQHSGLVEIGDTTWILLVEDLKKDYIKTLPEVRDEIAGTLQAEEQARIGKEWMDRLKAKSFVRYFRT
jgi:parvulin-like peptidyl-prolyl isomerase